MCDDVRHPIGWLKGGVRRQDDFFIRAASDGHERRYLVHAGNVYKNRRYLEMSIMGTNQSKMFPKVKFCDVWERICHKTFPEWQKCLFGHKYPTKCARLHPSGHAGAPSCAQVATILISGHKYPNKCARLRPSGHAGAPFLPKVKKEG